MVKVFKNVLKHMAVWFAVMFMMFFTAAPIARTDLTKWAIVAVLALIVTEVFIFVSNPDRFGKGSRKENA